MLTFSKYFTEAATVAKTKKTGIIDSKSGLSFALRGKASIATINTNTQIPTPKKIAFLCFTNTIIYLPGNWMDTSLQILIFPGLADRNFYLPYMVLIGLVPGLDFYFMLAFGRVAEVEME